MIIRQYVTNYVLKCKVCTYNFIALEYNIEIVKPLPLN